MPTLRSELSIEQFETDLQRVSESETLLPASDLSVILDACVKMRAR